MTDTLALPLLPGRHRADGWLCHGCDLFLAGWKDVTPSMRRNLPLTEADVRAGRTGKWGIACPNGCQVGQWNTPLGPEDMPYPPLRSTDAA